MTNYERFGLWKNPFEHNLIEAHHARKVDIGLYNLFERIKNGENETKIIYAVTGSDGFGKTDILRSMYETSYKKGIYSIYLGGGLFSTEKDKYSKRSLLGGGGDSGSNTEKKILISINKAKPTILLIGYSNNQ